MAETIEFNTVSHDEWEQIPTPKPPKPKDRFEQLLETIEKGSIVQLDTKEEKELKGTRIAIARKARNLGFLVEFKNVGNVLYVKRSEKPLTEKSADKSKPKTKKTEKQEE